MELYLILKKKVIDHKIVLHNICIQWLDAFYSFMLARLDCHEFVSIERPFFTRKNKKTTIYIGVDFFLLLLLVYNTVLPWFSGLGEQTVRRYCDRNWLWGLYHPLHLAHKSDAVMEWTAIETNFGALPGIEPGTLLPRVKDLNHWAKLLVNCLN